MTIQETPNLKLENLSNEKWISYLLYFQSPSSVIFLLLQCTCIALKKYFIFHSFQVSLPWSVYSLRPQSWNELQVGWTLIPIGCILQDPLSWSHESVQSPIDLIGMPCKWRGIWYWILMQDCGLGKIISHCISEHDMITRGFLLLTLLYMPLFESQVGLSGKSCLGRLNSTSTLLVHSCGKPEG